MGFLERVGRFLDDVLLLPDDVRERLEEAEALVDAEAWADAEGRLLEILRVRPSLARAWVGLAHAREGLGDAAGVREALEQARELAPDEGELALWQARLALSAGNFDAAADAAREASFLLAAGGGTSLAESFALRARAEWGRSRPDRAARELRKALAVTPDHPAWRSDLVRALADAGRPGAARAVAAGLVPQELDPVTCARIGAALGAVPDAARPWLERAASGGDPTALCALARLDLAAGDHGQAERRAREAVAAGADPSTLDVLAEVLLARGAPGEAAEVWLEAARDSMEMLRRAARIVPLEDPERVHRCAEALARVAPADPLVRALRCGGDLAGGGTPAPPEEEGDEPRVTWIRAWALLRAGRAREALEALDRFDRLSARTNVSAGDRTAADHARREAWRSLWYDAEGRVDLAAAIEAVARFASGRDLLELERRASALRDDLDRPLLLAVLGEFNAGKSTLVNAFVGADVAPTGILPTTATLNVLRSGAERRVRLVRRDGTTREAGWDDLRTCLEEEAPAELDRVEIVLPSEVLDRVWILDTPGTNASAAGHEELALDAGRRADAVMWVFDASQAGKATEGSVLGRLRRMGRAVIPVINKTDRLDPGALGEVVARLGQELSSLPEPVRLSARRALEARLKQDPQGWRDSGFEELERRIGSDVVERARELKRHATAHRLLEVVDQALATEEEVTSEHRRRVEELARLSGPMARLGEELGQLVEDIIRELGDLQDRAFGEAADEVLAFVRPRRGRFSRHGATREDREFLAQVLERRLTEANEQVERALLSRVHDTVARAVGEHLEPRARHGSEPFWVARARGALGAPFAEIRGLQRGLLRGGALDRFFVEVLPQASLERDALATALGAARAEPRADLRPPLREATGDLVRALEAELTAALADARAALEDLRARVYVPLRALRAVLAEHVTGVENGLAPDS